MGEGDVAGPKWRPAVIARLPGARRSGLIPLGQQGISLPEPARVLAIRPDHIGDVLLAGPALSRLRAGRPDDAITLMTGPWSAEIARRLPGPDAVETYRFSAFARSGRRRVPGMGVLDVLRLARRIRSGGWDAVFILRDDDFPSAWAAALAGVPVRVGHAVAGVTPFLTHALSAAMRPVHVTAAGVALVQAALGTAAASNDHSITSHPATDPLRLRLEPEDEAEAARWLAALGELGSVDRAGPVAIHPCAGTAVKRWTALKWAAVARAVCAPGEPLILTGSEGERPFTDAIARLLSQDVPATIAHLLRDEEPAVIALDVGPDGVADLDRAGIGTESQMDVPGGAGGPHPVLDLAGRTDIGALAAIYARCRLVLGPDSGPLHIAAAVGTPSVSLFGPADPLRFGPWGPPERHRLVASDLPCAPCGRLDWPDLMAHPCVRVLSASAVSEAAAECLHASSTPPY